MTQDRKQRAEVSQVLVHFTEWLEAYGERSWDYQSFFAGPIGGRAKALYYRRDSWDRGRRPDGFLRSILAIGTPTVSPPHAISDCGRPLRDGLRFPIRGNRRFVATRKSNSIPN